MVLYLIYISKDKTPYNHLFLLRIALYPLHLHFSIKATILQKVCKFTSSSVKHVLIYPNKLILLIYILLVKY